MSKVPYVIVSGAHRDEDGETVEVDIKCRQHHDGQVTFEVRNAVHHVIPRTKSFKLNKFINKELKNGLGRFFELLGVDPKDQFLDSLTSLNAKKIKVTDDMKNEQEWMTTSTGFLGMLLFFILQTEVSRRKRASTPSSSRRREINVFARGC